MNRYKQFRDSDDYVPQRSYEACVFLSNARLHLNNRSFDFEACMVLNDAMGRVNSEGDWVYKHEEVAQW